MSFRPPQGNYSQPVGAARHTGYHAHGWKSIASALLQSWTNAGGFALVAGKSSTGIT